MILQSRWLQSKDLFRMVSTHSATSDPLRHCYHSAICLSRTPCGLFRYQQYISVTVAQSHSAKKRAAFSGTSECGPHFVSNVLSVVAFFFISTQGFGSKSNNGQRAGRMGQQKTQRVNGKIERSSCMSRTLFPPRRFEHVFRIHYATTRDRVDHS